MSEAEGIKLPEPDTASLAMSGLSVDYINGYERGYEDAAEQVRQAVMLERERCARVCEELASLISGPHESDGHYALLMNCAASIRRGP